MTRLFAGRVQVRIPVRTIGLSGLFAILGSMGAAVSTSAAEPTPTPTIPGTASAPNAAPTEATLLPIGSPAPNIKATAHNGQSIELAKLKGQYVVFYFYPKDDTPGCTKQACDLRDNWSKLQKAGVTVFGVSTQDNASHKAFASKHTLPFALLPDDKGEIARALGVPVVDGKARRVTYLIGKDGKVKYVWPKAATTGHAAEILSKID
jgi:thioredoxin-dependent peroxiredoxin